jgi:hypothetical protein
MGLRGHGALFGMFPASHQALVVFAQSDLDFPADVLDGFGWLYQSKLEMPADFGGIAVRPGAFHERAMRMSIAGCGDRTLLASLPCGIFRGISPKNFMSRPGLSKRVRPPSSATVVTSIVNWTSRRAWRASTTGHKRQDLTCSWSSCSSRWRRSLCSVTARTYSWKTIC